MKITKNTVGAKFLKEVRSAIRWLGEVEGKRLQKAWSLFEAMSLVGDASVLKTLVKEELNKIENKVSSSYYKDLRALINGMMIIVTNYHITIRGGNRSIEGLFNKLVEEGALPSNIKGLQKLVTRLKKYKGNMDDAFTSFIPEEVGDSTAGDAAGDSTAGDAAGSPIKVNKHVHLDMATLSDIKKMTKAELKAAVEYIKVGLDKLFDLLEAGQANYSLITNVYNFLKSEELI